MKILVPYAGSRYSLGVLRLIARMSLASDSEIKILNVVPSNFGDEWLVDDQEKNMHRQIQLNDKSGHLRDLAKELQFWQKDCRVSSLVYFGKPKSSILKVAEEWGADLIVVGANEDHKLRKLIFGSVASYVMEHASCSVMIVRPTPDIDDGIMGVNGYRVLLPLVGSVYSYETLSWVTGQSWREGTRFKLLMALPGFPANVESIPHTEEEIFSHESWCKLKEQAFSMLEEHAMKFAGVVDLESISLEVLPGEPKEAILTSASHWKPDMIVVGSSAAAGLKEILSESVPEHIVRHAECAVVVVRRSGTFKSGRHQRSRGENFAEILSSIKFKERESSMEGNFVPHGTIMM